MSPGAAVAYTSYDGHALSLYPWAGRNIVFLSASGSASKRDWRMV